MKTTTTTLAALTLLALAAPNAHAVAVEGESRAYNLASTLVLLPIAPINAIGGSAPLSYDLSSTVINLDLGALAPLLDLQTGVLNTSASSNADGLDDFLPRNAEASTLVDGLGLALLGNVLELDLGAISSNAQVSGTSGAFVANGSSSLLGVSLDTILTMPLTISVWDNFAPNTKVIDDLLGITLTFNEQIENCGVDFCELTVNAINIEFDNVILGVGNLLGLSGNLIVGHSYASLATAGIPPVPEAETWALMLAGLGLVGFAARRRTA